MGLLVVLAAGVLLVLKLAVAVVLWPFKIAFKILVLPIAILGLAIKFLLGVILLPVAAVLLVVGVLAGAFALVLASAVSLVPLLILGAVVWAVMRVMTRGRAPARA